MKIPVDISPSDFIDYLKSKMTGHFEVSIGMYDLDFFKNCMRIAKKYDMHWTEIRDDILLYYSQAYGVQIDIQEDVFDDDFWITCCRMIFSGVKTVITLLPCADEVKLHFDIDESGNPNELKHGSVDYRFNPGTEKANISFGFGSKEFIPGLNGTDDNICSWTYWNGVPSVMRALIITAIRKIMSADDATKYVEGYWDTIAQDLIRN